MKKWLAMLLLVLGLTFIYNPATNVGYVYINDETSNYIILVDSSSNTMRSYRGVLVHEYRLDQTFETWLRDKVNKGMPFKSIISPYRSQQQQQYKEYYEKKTP